MADGFRSLPRANSASALRSATSSNLDRSLPRRRQRRLPHDTTNNPENPTLTTHPTAEPVSAGQWSSLTNSTYSPHEDHRAIAAHVPHNRDPSPFPGQRPTGSQILETSLRQGWASFRDLASSLVAIGDDAYNAATSRSSSKTRATPRDQTLRAADVESNMYKGQRGPTYASNSRVSRSLDRLENRKRRTSDAASEDTTRNDDAVGSDQMVYIHHVQSGDTYAGLTLKYRCHGDDIRKTNGLWSRDNIQVRKWLAVPVDRCEIRGTPCEAEPTAPRQATYGDTADASRQFSAAGSMETGAGNTQIGAPVAARAPSALDDGDDPPWTHVRWVRVEPFPHPIEIVRMPRRTLGYFPPRRKKTGGDPFPPSPTSTPRQSTEAASSPPGYTHPQSPVINTSSKRTSFAPGLQALHEDASPGARDVIPAWMRRPGGVGTLNRHVTAPGPDMDYLNSWTKKHIPSLNLDSYPSMSIAETHPRDDDFDLRASAVGIVGDPLCESDGAAGNSHQGSGLDRAAAAVETWMRGAFSTLRTGTPIGGAFSMGRRRNEDLIELKDAPGSYDSLAVDPQASTHIPRRGGAGSGSTTGSTTGSLASGSLAKPRAVNSSNRKTDW